MKKIIPGVLPKPAPVLVAFLILSAIGCKKDNNSGSSGSVSEEEAAEAVVQSVSPSTGGMVQDIDESASMASLISECGAEHDSTIVRTNAPGAPIIYSINLHWGWLLLCSGSGVPHEFDCNFTGSHTFDGPRISSGGQSNGSSNITGLEPSATEYIIQHDFTHTGNQQCKVLNKHSFTSTITVHATDIKVDKNSRLITSGTSAVSISGNSSAGKAFSYTGTLTFLGNKTASLTMKSGQTYSLRW